jgi:hypothetical protein
MFFHFQPEDGIPGKLPETLQWSLVHKKYDVYLCKTCMQQYVTFPEIPIVVKSKTFDDALKLKIIKKSKLPNLKIDDFFLVGGLI